MKELQTEIRTIKTIGGSAVYFREISGISAARGWFPGVEVGQKWKLTIDYSRHPTGKIVGTELVRGAP